MCKNLIFKTQLPFLCLTILLFSYACFGQEESKPILFDDFGQERCSTLRSRLDMFLLELQKKPMSKGHILIYSNKNHLITALYRESFIKGHYKFRKFNEKNFKIFRIKSKNEFKTQLWIVPKNSNKKFIETGWDLRFPKKTKPFIFESNIAEGGECYGLEHMNLNIFAELLKSNPKARGNIVIETTSLTKFRKETYDFRKIISRKYKISLKRIRFFFVKKRGKEFDDYPKKEVWILP